jgi:hypothetical protein
MKNLKLILAVMIGAASLFAQSSTNPGTFRAPTVKLGTTATSIYWTAGVIENGGHAVSVAAGNAALGASETSCAAPSYSACDILYANSSGVVAVTTTIATASAAGNTILAYIETGANSHPSNIALPLQSGALWTISGGVGGSVTAQSCGSTATCGASNISATLKVVVGIGQLVSSSPSTFQVTAMSPAFTSTTSYTCVAQDVTTIANNIGVLTAGYVSGSAVTFTGPNTNTDTFRYTCVGY